MLLARVRDDLKIVITELEASLEAKDMDKAKQNITTLRYLLSLETSIKAKNLRLGIFE